MGSRKYTSCKRANWRPVIGGLVFIPGSRFRSRTPAASESSRLGFPAVGLVVAGGQLRRHDDGRRAACTAGGDTSVMKTGKTLSAALCG